MITVVTPCYNQAEYLDEAIISVLSQTLKDFEYLLIDDGSTDDTWKIMQQWQTKDTRIRSIRLEKQPNVGVVLNRSIREANGDYWVWCPSDDRLCENLLERKQQFSQSHPKAVVYSDWEIIDSLGKVHCSKRVGNLWTAEKFSELVWEDSPIGFTGIWVPIEVFDLVGNFPTHLNFSEDFEWMIRATMHVEFIGMAEILYQKRKHSNRLTDRNGKLILEQVPRIRESLRTYQKLLEG